jgi:hypothetical protein
VCFWPVQRLLGSVTLHTHSKLLGVTQVSDRLLHVPSMSSFTCILQRSQQLWLAALYPPLRQPSLSMPSNRFSPLILPKIKNQP